MELYGELLDAPQLRFDYSARSAQDTWSKRGLTRYGPYDSELFGKDDVRAVVLFPRGKERQRDTLVTGLQNGEGKFRGFQSLFKVPIRFVREGGLAFGDDKELQTRLNDIAGASEQPDLVYMILPSQYSKLYVPSKARLLANGIPSQMVVAEKLDSPNGRQYTLENIALASYAKVGGTPWAVAAPGPDEQLILGVSRAQDSVGKHLVGYVTLFTKDGDFLFVSSKAPVGEWEQYVSGLCDLVASSGGEFERQRNTPASIIVHFHKNPGAREVEAITAGLEKAGRQIPFAIVHLNEFSSFRLFDARHPSYVPPKGLKVALSAHEALVMLDGRTNGDRRRVGVPRVLDVRLDKRSTLEAEHFPQMVKQVYDFAHINWRGFNAAAVPITLNYSKLIARMVADLGVKAWNETVAEGRLRDKAWFL